MPAPVATPAPPCRSLAEYVRALVRRLDASEPRLGARLRAVVGARRARIGLDDESIEVWFEADELIVAAAAAGPVDGEGWIDRLSTLALLAGRLEVTSAILDGRLRVAGEVEGLVRLFQAIEILLDGTARNPALQRLALDYLHDPCRATNPAPRQRPAPQRVEIDADRLPVGEREVLRRLDLLS